MTTWRMIGFSVSMGGVLFGVTGLTVSPDYGVTVPIGIAGGMLTWHGVKWVQRMVEGGNDD